ncbi:MAG: MBL fold metallo-hydrolase [Alphaproteobacteria bacterium]
MRYAAVFTLLLAGYLWHASNVMLYEGPTSDHYDNGTFFNPEMPDRARFWGLAKWMLTRDRAQWPDYVQWEYEKPIIPDNSVTFIGHACSLIRLDGKNILTDPMYSDRASPVSFAGPKRVHDPGVAFEDLPKIDVVVISHDHYDHFDIETIKRLQETWDPVFIVGLGNDTRLRDLGVEKVVPLDWWQSYDYQDVKITFVPVQHFSGRTLLDYNKTLWGGFVVQNQRHKVLFGGDAGYSNDFKRIYDQFGAMDLALLPIGSYEPRWFMHPVHVDPTESVQIHIDLHAKKSVGIHFGTFQMSDEAYDAPIRDLQKAREQAGLAPDAFVAPEFGQTFPLG